MRTVRAEVVALTTTRVLHGHVAAAAVLALLPLAIIPLVSATAEDAPQQGVPDVGDAAGQLAFLSGAQFWFLIAAILGAIVTTRRHRHRTIVPQLLVAPHRARTMLAQVGVLAVAGLLLCAGAAVLSTAAVAGGVVLAGESFAIPAGDVLRVVAADGLAGIVGACVGAGVGAVVRSSGVAISIVVVGIFVVESLIAGFLADVGQWLPSALLGRLELGDSEFVTGDVAPAIALALVVGYAAAFTAAAVVATTRRDAV